MPASITCLVIWGCHIACLPISKNVAFKQLSASAWSTAGVFSGHGPSSKVSTTSLSRRKSYCLKCSKPKPGPPVVSISTMRASPMPPGLSQAAILWSRRRPRSEPQRRRLRRRSRPQPEHWLAGVFWATRVAAAGACAWADWLRRRRRRDRAGVRRDACRHGDRGLRRRPFLRGDEAERREPQAQQRADNNDEEAHRVLRRLRTPPADRFHIK